MNKILRLFLAISLLITCFTVNVVADDTDTPKTPTEQKDKTSDVTSMSESEPQILSDDEPELIEYTVEQLENGDIVLTFDSKEHAKLVDIVYFEEVSKAKAGPSGVWKDSLIFAENKVVVTFNVIKNILQLKKGSTYKVHIAVSQNGIIDTTSQEITLNKGTENWDITAWVDDDSNLFIESTNSFINNHINWISLDEENYIDGYDGGPLFNNDEIINTDEYACVPGSYLKTFKLQNNVDYKVQINYYGEDGDKSASNRFYVNSVQFNYEQMIGPNLVGEVKNGTLYIKSENNSPEGIDYLNALYNNSHHYSDELSFNIAIDEGMCGVAGFNSEIFEHYEEGLKIKLYKYLHNIDYADSDKNELVLRVPGMGMCKVLFTLNKEAMKSKIGLNASVDENGIISLKIEGDGVFEKVLNGDYQLTYEPIMSLSNEEQKINSNFLSFDTANNIVLIKCYFGVVRSLTFSVKNEDELIGYFILDDYYAKMPYDNISPTKYVEAGSEEAKNIIKSLRENEDFVSYKDDLLNNSIALGTRTIEFGITNTMQTWMPYFLGNANKLGVDYSNSIPLKTYVNTANFSYDGQLTTSLNLHSPKPYSLETDIDYAINIPSSSISKLGIADGDFSDVVLAIVDSNTLKEIDFQITPLAINDDSTAYHLYFSHQFNQGSLILYNKANVKKVRSIEAPVVYAFENDFEGMKTFVDAQLKNGWKVFNKIDDIEQKLYPYYNTDKYLVGVINEGENGYVDVYKVLETNWVEIPEIQAIQDTKGNIIISYKDINKVTDYNDFLSNMSPEFSIKIANKPETIFNSGIRTDNTNKTWTLDYGNIFDIADKLDAGVKYNITIVPSLFGVKLDSTKSVDCYVTINKNSPVAKPVGSLDNGIVGVLNSDAKTHLNEKHPGSSITINRISTSFNSDVSKTDIDKYFKSFGLSANNSISLNIYLSVDYTTDGTSHYTEAMPYEYSGKYVDLSINVSLDAMAKLGITKENYSTQEIVVLREHNGEVTELPATLEAVKVGETIISFKVKFKTDKMSLFSVANKSSVVRPSSGNPSVSTKKPVVNTAAK